MNHQGNWRSSSEELDQMVRKKGYGFEEQSKHQVMNQLKERMEHLIDGMLKLDTSEEPTTFLLQLNTFSYKEITRPICVDLGSFDKNNVLYKTLV